jgi:hypothetical protein
LPNFLAVNVCRVNHYEVVLRNFLGANAQDNFIMIYPVDVDAKEITQDNFIMSYPVHMLI